MLDPSERLGAGELDSPNDVDALRRHPFFNGLSWETLWTDPAPPMEAGLVKKEHPLSDHVNYDVGAVWDQLVGDEEDIPWAEDSHEFTNGGPLYHGAYEFTNGTDEIGPLDSVPVPSDAARYAADVDAAELRGWMGLTPAYTMPVRGAAFELVESQPVNIPARNNSISTGSSTSSSEDSPVDRIGAAMEAMALDRGRDRATTPIQLAVPAELQWCVGIIPKVRIYSCFAQVCLIAIRRNSSLPLNH